MGHSLKLKATDHAAVFEDLGVRTCCSSSSEKAPHSWIFPSGFGVDHDLTDVFGRYGKIKQVRTWCTDFGRFTVSDERIYLVLVLNRTQNSGFLIQLHRSSFSHPHHRKPISSRIKIDLCLIISPWDIKREVCSGIIYLIHDSLYDRYVLCAAVWHACQRRKKWQLKIMVTILM